jgi:[ribosomal protein S5]-alanine N-acetyltransferase
MRIYLRAFEPEDYKLISFWRHDEEVVKLLGGNHFYVSSERERKWVEDKIFNDRDSIYLAVCLKEDDRMIGYTCITNIDFRNLKAEMGGTLIGDKTLWGKGYGREAAELRLIYLFEQYPINRNYVYCLEEHGPTIKMLLSLGYKQEGVLRQDVYKNGEFKNMLLFSMLRNEYDQLYKDKKCGSINAGKSVT